jgi:hypothetical protein
MGYYTLHRDYYLDENNKAPDLYKEEQGKNKQDTHSGKVYSTRSHILILAYYRHVCTTGNEVALHATFRTVRKSNFYLISLHILPQVI